LRNKYRTSSIHSVVCDQIITYTYRYLLHLFLSKVAICP